MERTEVSVAPPATQPEAGPVVAVAEQAPVGVVARLKSFIGSLNPLNQITEAEHQADLARDPSS